MTIVTGRVYNRGEVGMTELIIEDTNERSGPLFATGPTTMHARDLICYNTISNL